MGRWRVVRTCCHWSRALCFLSRRLFSENSDIFLNSKFVTFVRKESAFSLKRLSICSNELSSGSNLVFIWKNFDLWNHGGLFFYLQDKNLKKTVTQKNILIDCVYSFENLHSCLKKLLKNNENIDLPKSQKSANSLPKEHFSSCYNDCWIVSQFLRRFEKTLHQLFGRCWLRFWWPSAVLKEEKEDEIEAGSSCRFPEYNLRP